MLTLNRRAAAALALGFALTACGAGAEDIPGLTPDGVSVDTSRDGDLSVETENGAVTGFVGKLPAGFPTDEVPMLDGEVQSGVALAMTEEKGFTVTLTGADGDHDAAVALLTAKGFAVEGEFSAGGAQSTQLTSDAWNVLVSTITDGSQPLLSYTVMKPSA